MALRALMLRKKIDGKKRELSQARARLDAIKGKESELELAIDESGNIEAPEEQRNAQETIETEISQWEQDVQDAESAISEIEGDIENLERELETCETEDEPDGEPEGRENQNVNERGAQEPMITRGGFFGMTTQERDAIFAREDVKEWITGVRDEISQKRAISNVGLTIPEVFLGLLRENIDEYSKLYKYVTVRRVNGTGRQLFMAPITEAIWTECCANLNELNLGFYDEEYDCYMVGGYWAVCNANLEDSDIDLANEILTAAGRATGLALDKAILYGKNTSSNQKMPLGIVSRLAQTQEPAGYSATARPWTDLHQTNIQSIAAGTSGAALISAIASAFGNVSSKYAHGEKVWVMNEKTYSTISAATVSVDAQGRIVTGVMDRMPVMGGTIEILDFIPDNVIIAGYFDDYTLVERAGREFAYSQHVRFLNNQTVYKTVARYDGQPSIAEAFVAIGIEGTTPDATMTFAADVANAGA